MSFKLTLILNISSMAVFWKKQNSAKNVCTSGIALTPAVIWIPKFAIFVQILEHWDCSWDLISIVRSSLNSQSNGHCQMEFSIRITMKREVKARKKKEKRIFLSRKAYISYINLGGNSALFFSRFQDALLVSYVSI